MNKLRSLISSILFVLKIRHPSTSNLILNPHFFTLKTNLKSGKICESNIVYIMYFTVGRAKSKAKRGKINITMSKTIIKDLQPRMFTSNSNTSSVPQGSS